jgi:hypothetical protein
MLTQIITATETHFGNHGAHSRGVSAILQTEKSPFDLLDGAQYFRPASPMLIHGTLQVWRGFYIQASTIFCKHLILADSWDSLCYSIRSFGSELGQCLDQVSSALGESRRFTGQLFNNIGRPSPNQARRHGSRQRIC